MGYPLEGVQWEPGAVLLTPQLSPSSWKEGLSTREIDTLMNKKSGVLGVSSRATTSEILTKQLPKATESRTCPWIFAYKIKKVIGEYIAVSMV